MEFLTNNLGILAGGGGGALALWILKMIPNEDLYSWVETGAFWAGSVLTLGMGKWKLTKNVWASTVEPYLVDLFENTCGALVNGFIKGLRSDD